jgi:hypothetical protein
MLLNDAAQAQVAQIRVNGFYAPPSGFVMEKGDKPD